MEKETKNILLIILAFVIGALIVFISKDTAVNGTLNLDLTRQQHVMAYDTDVYLEDVQLESCADNGGVHEQDKICKFSCAPEGLCVFIPKDLMKYEF